MKRTYAFRNGKFVEITPEETKRVFNVQGDLKEFRSSDGKYIGGKRQWRDHLKRTGTIELGHSDIAASKSKWEKRKAAFAESLAKAPKSGVREVEREVINTPDYERSRLNAEVRNRLEGRPAPSRTELLKLTMDQAEYLGRRR